MLNIRPRGWEKLFTPSYVRGTVRRRNKTAWSFFNFRKDICPAKSLFERRSVTSRYNAAKFLDDNNRELKQQRQWQQPERQKNKRFRLAKQQLCKCKSRFLVHFLAVVARLRLRHETSWFHVLALRSRWTQHKNFLFLFLNLDTVLSDSKQKILPTFDKLNQIA